MISIPEIGHCLPLIRIGEELILRGHDVYIVSGNAAKETHLKKMGEEVGIKIIFTNDKLIKTEFTPGNYEDKPIMTWKENLKEVFIQY